MKKAAFFLHYKNGFFEKNNIEKLKILNPSWDIYPIGFDNENLLADSLLVNCNKYPKNNHVMRGNRFNRNVNINWTQGDLLIYESYLHKPKYDLYFYIEYDTVFNCSIDKFFDTKIYPSAVDIQYPINPNRNYVKIYKKYCNKITDTDMCWFGPTSCILLDNKTLQYIYTEITSNIDKYTDMYSEIRLGTLIKQISTPKMIRPDAKKYISWNPNHILINKNIPYFYHPIKHEI